MTQGEIRSAIQGRLARLEVRRREEMFSVDGGLFRATWHFSFGAYNDPENMGIGSLRVLNHDRMAPGSIWPMHRHEDVEAVTYILDGEFEHADSLGNGGVLEAGGVQVMTLGAGAEHSERNHSTGRELELLQLWILPSQKGLAPSVQQRQFTLEDRRNVLLQVVAPDDDAGDSLAVHQDASVYVSHLEDGQTLEQAFEPDRGGYLAVIQGRLEVNGEHLYTGDAAYVRGPGLLTMRASAGCELLLVNTAI